MTWFHRFAMRSMMPAVDGLEGVDDTDVAGYVRQIRREATWLFRLGLTAGTWMFMLTPLLTIYVPLPAFLLPKGLVDKHAQRMTGHPWYLVRQGATLVKMNAGLCWGRDNRVREKLGCETLEPDPGTWRTGA